MDSNREFNGHPWHIYPDGDVKYLGLPRNGGTMGIAWEYSHINLDRECQLQHMGYLDYIYIYIFMNILDRGFTDIYCQIIAI